MHELTRRSYLESMGIVSYISRGQLPGAAPTRRLVVSRRSPASPTPAAVPADMPATHAESSTAAAFREAADTVKTQLGAVKTQVATPAAVQSSIVAAPGFSIVAVIVGGYLWLEELAGSAVFREQIHLIRAMAKALGMAEGEVDVSQFDWPIHSNAQLDLGEDAARAGLAGFVRGKIDRGRCRGIIILGSPCRQKLDIAQLEPGQCVSTLSTGEMLREPQLKKQAWRDLLSIANRL